MTVETLFVWWRGCLDIPHMTAPVLLVLSGASSFVPDVACQKSREMIGTAPRNMGILLGDKKTSSFASRIITIYHGLVSLV